MTVVGKTQMVYVFLFCFFGLFFEKFNVNLYVVKHKNREKKTASMQKT